MAENNNQQNNGQGNNQQQNQQGAGNQQNQQGGNPDGGQQAPDFDYEKLAQIIAGKQNVAEDTILKNYFKQQGLTQEEAAQAIAAFKKQKAANTPDVGALQTQLGAAQKAVLQAQIESAAIMQAASLGIDAKTIPYLLKMTDLSGVVGQDGKINEESVMNALNKTLEDVPALKPSPGVGSGFRQVGSAGGNQGQRGNNEPLTLKSAISEALKK